MLRRFGRLRVDTGTQRTPFILVVANAVDRMPDLLTPAVGVTGLSSKESKKKRMEILVQVSSIRHCRESGTFRPRRGKTVA